MEGSRDGSGGVRSRRRGEFLVWAVGAVGAGGGGGCGHGGGRKTNMSATSRHWGDDVGMRETTV